MAGNGETGDELVQVLVPRRHLGKVYGFICNLMEADGVPSAIPAVPSADAGEPATDGWIDEWTEEVVRRNWGESPETVGRLLRHLADHPGQPVLIADVAKAVYEDGDLVDRQRLAGVLGAFQRRLGNRYDVAFPFWREWNYREEMWQFTMPENIARKHRELWRDGS